MIRIIILIINFSKNEGHIPIFWFILQGVFVVVVEIKLELTIPDTNVAFILTLII